MLRRALLPLLLCLLLTPAPASALLIWEDDSPERRAIEKLYQRFPRRGRELPVRVRIISPREFAAQGAPDGYTGWYDRQQRTIWCAGSTRAVNLRVFAHEYGHHFFHAALSEAERARWREGGGSNESFAVRFERRYTGELSRSERRELGRYLE